MARIEDLVKQIQEPTLRAALQKEVGRLKEATQFGLVFERHQPESVLLDIPQAIEEGSQVRLRTDPDSKAILTVKKRTPRTATLRTEDGTDLKVQVKDLLLVKGFDEPIFPTLTTLGNVKKSDERRAHLAIEADNFHALEMLCLTHSGQIDVIYIDPPYNTGAKDWKYNNNYVDEHDEWRHSRWLSFMEKRLRLAKRLLKPDGVLIVTIDEHEVANLNVLLAEKHLFRSARRQMVTIVSNAAGVSQGGFYRVEEYAIFCFLGKARPQEVPDDLLSEESKKSKSSPWFSMIRFGGVNSTPTKRPGLVYPIAIDPETLRIVATGPTLKELSEAENIGPNFDSWKPPKNHTIDGCPVVWPFRGDGSLATWQVKPEKLLELQSQGFVRVRPYEQATGTNEYSISYIKSGNQAKVLSGEIPNVGREPNDGPYILGEPERSVVPKTVWRRKRHDAGKWGSRSLRELLGSVVFDYAKSPYAVLDTLRTVLKEKPDATVLDFFAGSGTTLQAVAMLNEEDGGNRRSILVTNNEVEEARGVALRRQGIFPGDAEYEANGIFQSILRPRCEAAITGRKGTGEELDGEYLSGRELKEGFEENVEFLRMDYLDPNEVELGGAWGQLLPLMWLVAGGIGVPPKDTVSLTKGYVVLESNGLAVLSEDDRFTDLLDAVGTDERIAHIFFLTDSEDAFAEMSIQLPGRATYMWPRDYLRFFRRNAEARK